ncbi:RsmB/NOP family class I SAM-dependent RNA methyltransferase [Aureispira anguillae]|uniref:Class I SAM-dependent methyltransferase n=1 Tax=Aureispira anguillae TaxID=2864201 RepID=A0A915YB27_9BACT|nr:class I SAM-dependent methyltransferase [Aureispira anguillae]BDS09795.1 class I SAM-dependent methyltransferase [Aureispira anguillae]
MAQKYEKLRLYRNLVEASVKALKKIFSENQLADRVVQTMLRSNRKWGSKDRRFLAATIYDAVRWYRLHYEIYGKEPQTTEDWWQILGIMWILQGLELPDWDAFVGLNPIEIKQKEQDFSQILKIQASIPDWLDELGRQELGEQWAACIRASNEPAALVLRANQLKTSPEELIINLDKKGVKGQLMSLPDAVLVPKRQKLTQLPSYERGYFEIQDASSQEVAPFLEVKKGMAVVDACAGAGGKSLHLAALMENKGSIISLDVEKAKLEQLQKRSKRAAISIITTQTIQNNQTIQALHNTADRLLLDVPCSGLGTLKRSPHIKWRLKPDFLEQIKATQQQILQEYSPICQSGGKMVYATCSVLPSENQEQVQTFLKSPAGTNFRLIREKQILPNEGFDGFYMALLERI